MVLKLFGYKDTTFFWNNHYLMQKKLKKYVL